MPVYFKKGSGLPPGGAPGQILGKTTDGETVWVDPDGGVFRGDWAPDELARQYGFGSEIPAEFTPVMVGDGLAPVLSSVSAAATFGVTGTPDPHVGAVRLRINGAIDLSARSGLSLDLASTGIANITRVSCWVGVQNGVSSVENYVRGSLLRNGQVISSNPQGVAWSQIEMTCASSDTIEVVMRGTASLGDYDESVFITGLEIYATPQPYMLNEFVTYDGRMWKSSLDNNAETPGAGSAWVEALELPRPSGTTAERPDPAIAGVGYPYFDTTLNHPIWSTGTSWVDAGGITV